MPVNSKIMVLAMYLNPNCAHVLYLLIFLLHKFLVVPNSIISTYVLFCWICQILPNSGTKNTKERAFWNPSEILWTWCIYCFHDISFHIILPQTDFLSTCKYIYYILIAPVSYVIFTLTPKYRFLLNII